MLKWKSSFCYLLLLHQSILEICPTLLKKCRNLVNCSSGEVSDIDQWKGEGLKKMTNLGGKGLTKYAKNQLSN